MIDDIGAKLNTTHVPIDRMAPTSYSSMGKGFIIRVLSVSSACNPIINDKLSYNLLSSCV